MNLRKIFNIPSSAQKSVLESEHQRIDVLILERQQEKIKTTKEINHKHNFNCPKCYNSCKDTIVDRIADVSGGIYRTRTEPVNHCNKCGNEWRKGTATTSSIRTLVKVWKNFIIEDNHIPVGIEDFSAEAIQLTFHEWGCSISLRELRKKFHSVYDKKSAETEKA